MASGGHGQVADRCEWDDILDRDGVAPLFARIEWFLRLSAPSSWAYLSSASRAVMTLVRWRVSASFADATVTRGATVRLAGKVAPVRAGTAVHRKRYINGAWTTVASTTVRSDGGYTFSFTWKPAGTYTYRVVVPGTSLNATGSSATLKLSVS